MVQFQCPLGTQDGSGPEEHYPVPQSRTEASVSSQWPRRAFYPFWLCSSSIAWFPFEMQVVGSECMDAIITITRGDLSNKGDRRTDVSGSVKTSALSLNDDLGQLAQKAGNSVTYHLLVQMRLNLCKKKHCTYLF